MALEIAFTLVGGLGEPTVLRTQVVSSAVIATWGGAGDAGDGDLSRLRFLVLWRGAPGWIWLGPFGTRGQFAKAAGSKVTASYAASSALAKQIEQGAPADVFASSTTHCMGASQGDACDDDAAAMTQPLFGIMADRLNRRIFVILGPTLTVLAMGLMGLAPSYALLMALLLIAGTGTASFHPQGASTAGEASGHRKGAGLSLFVGGGELGYSLGPLVIALIVAARGLETTWLVALPGLAACLLLWRSIPSHRDPPHRPEGQTLTSDLAAAIRPLAVLWIVVVLRTVVISGY